MSDHMNETTVGPDFDPKTWDIVGGMALIRRVSPSALRKL